MNNLSILQKVVLFEGFADDEISSVLTCFSAQHKTYIKNQNIYAEGDKTDKIGIIITGRITVSKTDINGNLNIIQELYSSDIFGEVFACLGNTEINVNVTASETTEILFLDFCRIVKPCCNGCDFHSKLIINMMKILALKNLFLNSKNEILSKKSIREKLFAFFETQISAHKSNDFYINFTRNDLADFLCVDRSALSRELGNMQNEGLILFEKNHFIVKS